MWLERSILSSNMMLCYAIIYQYWKFCGRDIVKHCTNSDVIMYKTMKKRISFLEEICRFCKFYHFTRAKDQNAITVHDCVEAVSNCEDCFITKFFLYRLLNKMVCVEVNVGCCFIDAKHLEMFKNTSKTIPPTLISCA